MEIKGHLKTLGLNDYETRTYMALLSLGSAEAKTISARTRIPRGRIYDVLNSLVESNLVEAHDSRPRKFHAIAPKIALRKLVEKRNKELESKSRQLNKLISEIESTMTEMMTNANENFFWIVTHGYKENMNLLITSMSEVKNEILSYSELDENNLFSTKINNEFIRMLRRNVSIKAIIPADDVKDIFSLYERDFISKIIPFIGKNLIVRTVEEVHSPFDVIDGEKINIIIKNPNMPQQFLAAVSFLDKGLGNLLREEFYTLWETAEPLDFNKIFEEGKWVV